jgi:MFS family permease
MVLATMVVTLVVGGVLAPVVSRLDIYAPYWFASLLFLIAGGLIWFARIPGPDAEADAAGKERHPFHQVAVELKEGFAALAASPVLLLSFYELALAVLVMFMMFTLAPAYVSQVLGIEAQDSYVILLPATVGALATAAVLGQLGRKVNPPTLMMGALVSTGLTLVLLAGAPALFQQFDGLRVYTRWVGSVFSLLLGVEFGVLLIPALTYLMENTSDSIRGRVFALLFMVVNGVTALPVLLTAVLSDWFGISHVIGALGVLLAGTGVVMARYARRVFAAAAQQGPA